MDFDFTDSPWHQSIDKAAYAAQALVSFLDPKQGFASPLVRTIFQYRSGFAFTLPTPSFDIPQLDQLKADWLSAVLAKIAQRGLPAPCSLKIERHILNYAQSVEVLNYQEQINGGTYQFRLNPRSLFRQNFRQLVYAALYPELLVDDDSLKNLIQCYLSVSTPLEQDLFNRLQTRLNDPRLALFVIPQRRMEHLLSDALHDAQRPDFSIELPSFHNQYCLRLVLEAGDLTHQETNQIRIDQNRDARLIKSGWQVKRFRTWESDQWDDNLDQVATFIHQIITPDLQDAIHQLRSLPAEQKNAVQNLVALPAIEAQLLVALAQFIRKYGTAQL
ncbi:hypothetical protein [Candidatus Contendibacter odensensis]|uniref:DUF559 domain-containing protein n=1 Tax=Candidatus Contendobacter odensis Run_B_J11 TaxID=1400861 RepID=A0A7U7GGA0_9GAMM|nr:hypothetical protein [Candidatus Contendobacter odensis]CDH47538.1 hypothetical protein BN874_840001 [Candidatus Contendobacter odensis Run_B_J11]